MARAKRGIPMARAWVYTIQGCELFQLSAWHERSEGLFNDPLYGISKIYRERYFTVNLVTSRTMSIDISISIV